MINDTTEIIFDDGDAYERYMGVWSRIVGEHFIQWLKPETNSSFADIGCGNGAFSVQIDQLCYPKKISGIDPAEAQINYAKELNFKAPTEFIVGDAMSLPFEDESFEIAVMALVLFFVPDPALGLSEMKRITQVDGLVAAYVWDVLGGGLPMEPLHALLRDRGIEYPLPPSKEVSQIDAMESLWKNAGFTAVSTTSFQVERTFKDFDEYWSVSSIGPSVAGVLKNLKASTLQEIKHDMENCLKRDDEDRIVTFASANAVKGVKI